jgi:hypothetical protein
MHRGVATWADPTDGGRLQRGVTESPREFTPPASDDQAAFDWQSALSRYPGPTPRTGVGPAVTLARMRRCGETVSRLVYVLRWDHVQVRSLGGPALQGGESVSARSHTGFWISVMDAISAEHIFALQSNRTEAWPDDAPASDRK